MNGNSNNVNSEYLEPQPVNQNTFVNTTYDSRTSTEYLVPSTRQITKDETPIYDLGYNENPIYNNK